MPTDRVITLLAKWINEFQPVSAIETLLSGIEQARVDSPEAYEIGGRLIDAINDSQ